MKPLLIYVRPLDPVTGNRVDVRLGSVPSPVYAGLGGLTWEGAVSRRPRLMLDLMSTDLNGKVQTGRGDFMVNLNHVKGVSEPASLMWSGAPVTVYDATSCDYANMPVEFIGIVSTGLLDVWTRQLILNLEVEKGKLDRPLLSGEFTGGGGILGDADKRGTLWPAGFGFVENCEPVWFDAVNNVGMLDGYSNLTTVHGLYEGGDDRGASFGDYASYAALVAAAIPKGRWATCLALGLVRLGAPPAMRISCDCTFRGAAGTGANRPGALIRRVLETHAGIPTGDLDLASFASLDTAVPRNVHYWTKDQRDCLDLVEAISASCNATTLILLNGKIAVTRAFGGAVFATINRTGTSNPPVTDWAIQSAEEPLWRMRGRSCRPGTVFSFDEILYADDLIDKGAYSATETYRQGHLVWMPDGSQWLYINATPSAGNSPAAVIPPATSNAYWSRTRAPTTAADLVFSDGQTIQSIKPKVDSVATGATADLKLNLNGTGLTIVANSFTCPVLQAAWAGSVYSTENYVEGFTLEAVYTGVPGAQQDDLIGVGAPGGSLANGNGFLYALNPSALGVWYWWESGTTATTGIAVANGDRIRIVGDGVNVRYYIINGAGTNLVRTIARTDAGQAFRFQAMTFKAGGGYSGIVHQASARLNFNVIGGATRPSDNAGTSLLLTTVSTNVLVVGNTFSVTALGGTMSQGVNTTVPLRGTARLEFKAGAASIHANAWLATSTTGGTDHSTDPTAIGGLSLFGGFYYYVAPQSGTFTLVGSHAVGDVFALEYDGVNVRVLRNGGAYATFAAARNLTVYGRMLHNTANTPFTDIQWLPYTDNSWGSFGGANIPSDNAGTTLLLGNVSGPAGAVIIGNTIDVQAPSASLDQLVASNNSFSRAAYIEAKFAAGLRVNFGLSQDRTTYLVGTHWIGGVWVVVSGNISAYDTTGTLIPGSTTALDPTAVYAIDCDGIVSTFTKNGAFYASCAVTAGQTFFAKALFGSSAGGKLTAFRFEKGNSRAWSDEGGAGLPANNAGTTVILTNIASGAVSATTIIGNTVRQSYGSNSYFPGVYGQSLEGPCFAEADISGTEWTVVGLDTDNTTYDYSTQDAIGFYNKTTGGCQLYFQTAQQFSITIATGLTGKVRIHYDGAYIRLTVAGVLRGSPIAAPAALATNPIYPKWWPYTINVTYTGLLAGYFTDRYLDNLVDGGTYARLPVATSTGTGTARRALIDLNQGHTNKTVDFIGDGSTYARILAAQLSSGSHKLTVAGSTMKLGDARNLPNVVAANLGYKTTWTITYTAAAGTPATATISVTAGDVVYGGTTSYNASSVPVTGTGGTTVTYFLYYDDPTNAGGAQTLIATTTALTVYQSLNRVYVGTCDVFFPASGTGGGGGAGGGGNCVVVESFLPGFEEPAGARRGGEQIVGLDYETMAGEKMIDVQSVTFSWELCVEIESASGILARASTATPITVRDMRPLGILQALGEELPVRDLAGFRWEEIVRVTDIGVQKVAHIHTGGGTYAAGLERDRYIFLHNPNPKP